MKLIFLNRFAYPDHSATSQILSDLAFNLAASGENVHVITTRQRYDNPTAELVPYECIKGVHFNRVRSTTFGRSSLVGRSIDYLSFYISMRQAILNLAEADDTLVAMTDPPLISNIATAAARRKNARVITWLQDIYPEVAIELGVPLVRYFGWPISLLRDRSLLASKVNVVVGERMREALLQRGVSSASVRTIHNWTDDVDIVPIAAAENKMRAQLGLTNKFVVGYSGNLGRAHEYDTVLEAAGRLDTNSAFVFLFIGSGHGHSELRKEVKARRLEATFRFLPYQPRDILRYSMNVPDVHWMSLRPNLEGFIVPSKFYSAAAAGRPIIAIGAADGELGRAIQRHGCGFVCKPGDAAALTQTLLDMEADRTATRAMGERARAMLDAKFTKAHAMRRWRDLIEEVRHLQ